MNMDAIGEAAVELLDVARALQAQDLAWFAAQKDPHHGMASYYKSLSRRLCVVQAYLQGGAFVFSRPEVSPASVARLQQMETTVDAIVADAKEAHVHCLS